MDSTKGVSQSWLENSQSGMSIHKEILGVIRRNAFKQVRVANETI